MSNTEIYNMDCMEGMKQYPDKYFDICIADPPYGIGDKLVAGGTWSVKYQRKGAAWDITPSEEYFNEMRRVSKNYIVWGANYFSTMLPTSRCFIAWVKPKAILIEKGIVKPKELNETGKKELAEKETKKAEKEKKKLEEKILAETKKQFAVEVGKEFVGFKEFDGFDEQSDALRVLAIFTILNAGQFRSVVSRYVKLPEEHDKIYLFLIEYLTTAPIETVVEIWLASVTESIQPNGFTDIRDYLTDTAEEYGVTREDVEREIIDEMDDDE